MGLIKVEKEKVFTDSLKFSERLDVNHRNVLKDIRELVATNVAVQNEFLETNWTNAQNRTYPKFDMTKKGFMSLIMNTNVTPAKKNYCTKFKMNLLKLLKKWKELFYKENLTRKI